MNFFTAKNVFRHPLFKFTTVWFLFISQKKHIILRFVRVVLNNHTEHKHIKMVTETPSINVFTSQLSL